MEKTSHVLHITPRAAEQVKSVLDGEQILLRIDAVKGGCSGYKYTLDATESIAPNDVQFSSNGLILIADSSRLNDILGSLEIDYQDGNLVEQGFTFKPISAGDTNCGCGKSFAPVKGT